MIIGGFDLETGTDFKAGTPVEDNWITELGAVQWDTELGLPVSMMNKLILPGDNVIADNASEYTGITQDMIERWGHEEDVAMREFYDMWQTSDAMMAHNALGFDKPIIEKLIATKYSDWDWKPQVWIDSRIDIPYPWNCKHTNLTYLSAFHQVWNPFGHRAITDTLVMLGIADKYDWDEILESAKSPQVRVRAVTDAPNWNNAESMKVFNATKDKIKAAGFRWDSVNKVWELETKKIWVERNAPEWEFNWKIIQGENNDQY